MNTDTGVRPTLPSPILPRPTRRRGAPSLLVLIARLVAISLALWAVQTIAEPAATAGSVASAGRSALACAGPSRPIGRLGAAVHGPGARSPVAADPPPAGAVTGVDLSHWDGTVPYARLRDAGHRFVIAKASQGTSFRDPAFARHVAGARAAGLDIGAYHFFDYRVDGRAQADLLLATVAAAGLGEGSLPVVIDVECFAPFGSVPVIDAVARFEAMVARLYARTGRLPMVYTSRSMWSRVMGGDPRFGDLPLWVACWGCARPLVPAGWSDHVVWQTGAVALPGRGRRLDGNVVLGGETALARLRGRAVRLEDGPAVAARPALVDLGSLGGASVRWRVGGGAWSEWQDRGLPLTVTMPETAGPALLRVQGRDARGTLGPVARLEVQVEALPPDPQLAVTSVRTGGRVMRGGLPTADVALRVEPPPSDDGAAWLRTTCRAWDGRRWTRGEVSVGSTATVRVGTRWCRIRVRPTVAVAGAASAAWGSRIAVIDAVPSERVHLTGPWTARGAPGAIGGAVLAAEDPGAAVEVAVRGRAVAIVGPRGEGWAPLGVAVDDGPIERVEPVGGGPGGSVVWWSSTLEGGQHRIRVVVLEPDGEGDAARPAAIDGVLVVQVRRTGG
jgi:lysozyme